VTWMMWRQHRAEALALGVLIAVVAALLLVLGRGMHELFPEGIAHCLTPPLDQGCRSGVVRLQQDYGYSTALLILLNFAPLAIGGFLGAPMLARELESGTWQLAWTQATPRMRWLAVKVAVLGLLSVLLTAALSAAVGWYRQPLDLLGGGLDITGFDLVGIVPMAYGLFAFALGAAAGTLLRRSLPAAGAAVAAFVAVRVAVAGWLRPHFLTPIERVEAITPGSGHIPDGTGSVRDMILDQGYMDAGGKHITGLAAVILEGKAGEHGADPSVYLHDHGIRHWVVYQPVSRFWTLQLIETGIFVGLAAVLLALVVWRVRRRSF
jgi:hypothetical protein